MSFGRAQTDFELYESMLADNRGAPPEYRAGKLWAGINREFSALIRAGELDRLRDGYINRRFAGPEPASMQVYGALLWLYYNQLLERDTEGWLDSASDSAIGGSKDIVSFRDGQRMSLDFLQSVDEAFTIREAWRESGRAGEPEVMLELGAGYGRLANVCRQVFPRCTYVIVDLPESLACAASWLRRVRPDEAVPYMESRERTAFNRETLSARRLWTLGTQQLEAVAPRSVDVFVNVYSFAEMPRSSVVRYFEQIERTTCGIFYSKQRRVERNPLDGQTLSEHDYPIRSSWRELMKRPSTLYPGFFEAAYDLCPEK